MSLDGIEKLRPMGYVPPPIPKKGPGEEFIEAVSSMKRKGIPKLVGKITGAAATIHTKRPMAPDNNAIWFDTKSGTYRVFDGAEAKWVEVNTDNFEVREVNGKTEVYRRANNKAVSPLRRRKIVMD